MRNKGFFWFLTVLLTIVCVYQLSFTWVTSNEEKKAEKEALFLVDSLRNEAKSNNNIGLLPNGEEVDFSKPESEELAKAAFINQVLKSKADAPIYPVLGSNFQQVKSRSLAFGLDLVGGMSVTLEVSVPDLIKSFARNPRDSKFKRPFESALNEHLNKGGDFIDLFVKYFKQYNGNALIVKELDFDEIEGLDNNSSNAKVVSVFRDKVKGSMNGVEQIMSKRINQFGVAQPNIQKDLSSNRIYIELPGVQDEATVVARLKSTANLQFFETYNKEEIQNFLNQANALSRTEEVVYNFRDTTLMDSTALAAYNDSLAKATEAQAPAKAIDKGLADYLVGGSSVTIGLTTASNRAKIDKILAREDIKKIFPADLKFMWSANLEVNPGLKEPTYQLFAIRIPENGKARVGGNHVKNANVGVDQTYGTITVNVTMTVDGSERWAEMTNDNKGRCVAITMDDVVYSAPLVRSVINGGNTEISGNFSREEAESLSGLLNGGSLPAPCVIKDQSKVGPTIGAENSKAGLISFGIAFFAVFAYMFFIYGKAGMVANVALAINVVFIFGCLASFGAVLTLAGIAGIVLTIGTAVDANILIFERVREEQKRGVDLKSAVGIGFHKALPSIIDANVAHLLVAIILKTFGTGEIASFATTLIIGIFTSVFSAIIITKLIITSWVEKGKDISFSTKLSANLFQNFHFDWIGKRKYFYIFSIAVTVLGIVALVTRGLNPSVEFTGGRTISVKLEKEADIEMIKANLEKVFVEKGVPASVEVKTKSNNYNIEVLTNYKLADDGASAEVAEKLKEGLDLGKSKTGEYQILESRTISNSVSQEMLKSSTISIGIALMAIFAYIMFRFGQWQYSLGAIVGLAHDVMFTISIFALLHGIMPFNMDVNQAFIAAILTVIGYSMNDTVIVFDRIRENLNSNQSTDDHAAIINSSLNTTLSRTFNTSMVLFVVLLIMFIFGGPAIKGFLFALLIGVVIGTYSSLCVATPILLDFNKKLKVKKVVKVNPAK
ncbi:MAG: protein translocase subunit SecD [Crocinitomicaceae bacterium]|nr:MAG: protein translocase subunit SecD [Crocinitomicaceae bacterium]